MPTYTYRCDAHGGFDAVVPMAASDQPQPCPECATPAVRRLCTPNLSLGDQTARRLLDVTKATAERPSVVASSPGRTPARPQDSRWSRLPRP